MTEQTTTPAALWIAADGRITCTEHGGMALAAAVEAHPERLAHVTEERRELWAAQLGEAAAAEIARCETCGRGAGA